MEYIFTYLDFNATTPVDDRVVNVITSHLTEVYGNASSLYNFGNKAKLVVDRAKISTANVIGSDQNEIYFTSGATESINLALKGLALHPSNTKKHIITCTTEHKAVLETCHYLETIGFDITYLPVDNNGVIDLGLLKTSINEDTLLVCIMWVNNETGVIHPIREIGEITKDRGVYFVCDGTQGVGKLELDVIETNIDILCFSGHKVYAPKGIGGIYINDGLFKQNKLQPQIHGGGQENGLRSGTYNVPLIAGLGKAYEIAVDEMQGNRMQIDKLRDFIENELLEIKGAFINSKDTLRIYNTVNVCIPGFETEIFIGMNKDIAVSNGSACSSALIQPSHVLLAMGLSNDEAMNSLRISMGKDTTFGELQILIKRIKDFMNY
ncbi:cysteine desulfurase family protein [Flavobacterium sp. FlaQc-52]|uniref:cysteine desulfurase family protein n=1 Tax=Flavobacterium sp. FlaQc-52 TaxID=3374185 RepID=UPI003757BCE1